MLHLLYTVLFCCKIRIFIHEDGNESVIFDEMSYVEIGSDIQISDLSCISKKYYISKNFYYF